MTDTMPELKPLEEMSVKQLQARLGELGFASPEVLTSTKMLIQVINNYMATQAAAQKAIDDANAKAATAIAGVPVDGMIPVVEDTAVRKVDEKGKVINPLAPRAEDRQEEKSVEKRWAGKAAAMKANLDAQQKVTFLIPLGFGEKRGAYETVIMNGYRLNIMKGVIVEVPKQVAALLAESYQLTAEAGSQFLMDRDDAIKNRLAE